MHSPIVSNVCVTKNRAPYYEDIYLVYKTRVNVVMAVFRLSAAPLTEAHWGHTLMRRPADYIKNPVMRQKYWKIWNSNNVLPILLPLWVINKDFASPMDQWMRVCNSILHLSAFVCALITESSTPWRAPRAAHKPWAVALNEGFIFFPPIQCH